MNSLWTATASLPSFPSLKEDIKTDVLVIGGGIAGILCAHHLTRAGINCVLLEADRLCSGVTKNTTAKLTVHHGLIYQTLLSRLGTERAKMYLQANQAALSCYRELCREFFCDFSERDNLVYSRHCAKDIEKELHALQKLGVEAAFSDRLPLPFPVAGAVRLKRQGQFHPLRFLTQLVKPLTVYEQSKVQELINCKAVTAHGSVTAEKIIVATHFPFLNKHGSYFLKLYQHRSYVLALENAPPVDGMYVDNDKTGLSLRSHDGLLLLGGGSHRTGKQGGGWKELESFAKKYDPDATVRYRWATQDCMTLDGIPYIGQYSPKTPRLFVATGFNKWGMTSAMAAAMILTDLVQEKKHPCAPVFAPDRTMLHPQLFLNAGESALNLLTPTAPRCPHLGCALKWNREEHSWDCPCHGSRFTKEGHLIDNPATDDLKHPPKKG